MAEPQRNPVLQWSDLAQEAGERWDIPPAVLLGLTEVESGGNINAVSSAGAFGLTQFIPSTARSYGVRRGDARSMFEGAARYLRDLGYKDNPRLALAKYNAGPANPAAAGNYPEKVLAAARKYRGLTPRSGGAAAPPAGEVSTGGGVFAGKGEGAVKALMSVLFIGAGLTLAGLGAIRMTGKRYGAAAAAPKGATG